MIVYDLGVAYDALKEKIEKLHPVQERSLPRRFKEAYSEFVESDNPDGYKTVEWYPHTAVITTTTGKKIYLPNQWFYIAAATKDFFGILDDYKNDFSNIFTGNENQRKEIATELKNQSTIQPTYKTLIEDYYTSDSRDTQIEWFIKFVTDYNWWGGGKTIDRGDFHISTVTKAANLLNETQTAVAEIAIQLHNHPDIRSLLPTLSPPPAAGTPLLPAFKEAVDSAGLRFSERFIARFVAALCTRPFVILTGLSGSGKTRLATAFANWITEDNSQVCLVPVGADWTGREPLLGYPNALESGKYVKPDNGILDLLIAAENAPDKPFFLILDEMNLSHVERYFADFLSVMETDSERISLHPQGGDWERCEIPADVSLPGNLFIIGTVNIDETTYMFSPKVLDRAGVLEFRVAKDDMASFLNNPQGTDLTVLHNTGKNLARAFLDYARQGKSSLDRPANLEPELTEFFSTLRESGVEYGYRTALDMVNFSGILKKLLDDATGTPAAAGTHPSPTTTRPAATTSSSDEVNGQPEDASPASASSGKPASPWAAEDNFIIDATIILKILPRLHGSRKQLQKPLDSLKDLCVQGEDVKYPQDKDVKYPLCLDKINRMKKRLENEGFTGFAEA